MLADAKRARSVAWSVAWFSTAGFHEMPPALSDRMRTARQRDLDLPALIATMLRATNPVVPDAVERFLEFFAGRIANGRTRAAYRAVPWGSFWRGARRGAVSSSSTSSTSTTGARRPAGGWRSCATRRCMGW